MRARLAVFCLACFPLAALADNRHIIEVINDTRSQIDSFAMAPAGTGQWSEIDFRSPLQDSSFDYEVAVTLEFHDGDGCLRDLRTVLSDGRRIFAHNFDLCHFHAYRPGTPFRHSRSQVMP